MFPGRVHDVAEQPRQQVKQIGKVNKTHLRVHGHVLAHVPGRDARFGAVNRRYLIDPLQNSSHDLLVELRGLRQRGVLAEIIGLEDFRSAFGGAREQLGRMDLNEIEVLQVLADGLTDAGLDLENSPFAYVAQADDAVFK